MNNISSVLITDTSAMSVTAGALWRKISRAKAELAKIRSESNLDQYLADNNNEVFNLRNVIRTAENLLALFGAKGAVEVTLGAEDAGNLYWLLGGEDDE